MKSAWRVVKIEASGTERVVHSFRSRAVAEVVAFGMDVAAMVGTAHAPRWRAEARRAD